MTLHNINIIWAHYKQNVQNKKLVNNMGADKSQASACCY